MRITIAAMLLAGCGLDDPPAQPSWQVDVMPVLAANCVRCHGYPTLGFAAFGMRLDSYAPVQVVGLDAPISGAANNATLIAQRITRSPYRPGDTLMPPGRDLGEHEQSILRNWAGNVDGAMNAPRGAGRSNNAEPAVVIEEIDRAAGLATFRYELSDPDRDLVVGSVRGPHLKGVQLEPLAVIGDLVSGTGTFVVDLRGVPAGSYPLTARLDDGADIDGPEGVDDYIEVDLGMLVVP